MDIIVLGTVFSFSFVVALSGAITPGPLLTYTIIQTLQNRKRGYMTGIMIIAGHAILEAALIGALLFGFSFAFKNKLIIRIIGIGGGGFLLYFGISVIRDVLIKRISGDFIDKIKNKKREPDVIIDTIKPKVNSINANSCSSRISPFPSIVDNHIIGGILVSMSNPYWWIWWATIGFTLMIKFKVSFVKWPILLLFFIGHEAGDLLWYGLVSCLVFMGKDRLTGRFYNLILIICGMIMIGFGIYLGISSAFLNS